jgi:CRP-like cAMP-binding protein
VVIGNIIYQQSGCYADELVMNQVISFSKGQTLYQEGGKTGTVYLIQSGQVSLCITRGKSQIEIYRAVTGMMVGTDAIVSGVTQHTLTAVALTDVKALPVPVETAKKQIDTLPQLLKFIVKGSLDKERSLVNELRAIQSEKDTTPMAGDHVAKVFACAYYAAKSCGQEKEGKLSVSWPSMKKYATRVFLESPIRLEQACLILKKLKICEFEMAPSETDPNGAMELAYIHFKSMKTIEQFFDYYQNFYFKGQAETTLKFDERSLLVGFALRKAVAQEPIDANGIVTANFGQVLERLKTILTGSTVSVDTLGILEAKGLNLSRKADKDGGTIQFYVSELEIMLSNWMILREVERLNDVGTVADDKPTENKAA